MPNSSSPVSGGSLSVGIASKPVNNLKRASISVATNGFVVSMQKVTEYGEEWAIAATTEDITTIISDYFAA